MNNKIPNIIKEDLEAFYWKDKLSLSKIAIKFNCSTQTILNYFKIFQIKTRNYSDSLKGRKILWGDKIGNAHKGKILSEVHRNKISETRILRNIIPVTKGLTKAENPDIVKWGCPKEKHWNWKGGISKIAILIRQSSEYKLWRKKCFQRDNYICQGKHCYQKGGYLNVHHIVSFAYLLKNKKDLFNINNGITLCKSCHKKYHKKNIDK